VSRVRVPDGAPKQKMLKATCPGGFLLIDNNLAYFASSQLSLNIACYCHDSGHFFLSVVDNADFEFLIPGSIVYRPTGGACILPVDQFGSII
jgi:hypothetical protein